MIEYFCLTLYSIVIYALGVITPFFIVKMYKNLTDRHENKELEKEEEIKEEVEKTENAGFSNLSDEIIDEWQNGGDSDE